MTGTTTVYSVSARRYSWTSSYVLTRKLHPTWLKTMQMLAEGKCPLDSDLHEQPIMKLGMTITLHVRLLLIPKW